MRRVTYIKDGDSVSVNAFGVEVELTYGGELYVHGDKRLVLTAEAFEGLRNANPNVEFVEESD